MSSTYTDFLVPSIVQIRHAIRGIDDSYNNFWDILAELVQNSVDAIGRVTDLSSREIHLFIDCQRKEISIRDNGCGIAPEKLVDLLRPFSTDKLNDADQIGEKGVGLKFAYFQSTYFSIHTGNSSRSAKAIIHNARLWKEQTDGSKLELTYEAYDTPFSGTEIKLAGIENEVLFSLSIPQMKYILRTKTAIGNTSCIWSSVAPIKITLSMIDCNGVHCDDEIPYRFALPTDILSPNDYISLETFQNWLSENDHTDFEKRAKLKDKVITKQGCYQHNGSRNIYYWACFVPARDVWEKLSLNDELATADLLTDEDWCSERGVALYSPGIYTAAKGMPTGITVDHPSTGYSGYWPHFFILFEDNQLRFDIGRKAIHGRTARIYSNYAKDIFNTFLKYIAKYVSGSVDPVDPEWNKEKLIEEIKDLPNIDYSATKFLKNPKDQEASVAAIFYELIGAGHISGIRPLISGYRNKYDLYAKWNDRTIIIEFKAHLKNIARDFDDARKLFDEMDYIVCWDVTDDDTAKLHDLSLTTEELSPPSQFSSPPTYIPCCTHRLLINANATPLYIIDLKRVLASLQS